VVGYTLCFTLMGALAVQAYIYFTRFTDDRRAIKAFVIVVLLLETLLSVLVFDGFWGTSTVPLPNRPADGITATSSFMTEPFGLAILTPVTGLEVTTLTHGFYCWRIWTLRQSRLIPFPVMMVSLLQLASIIIFTDPDGFYPASDGNIIRQHSLSPWLVTWLGSSVVCDLAITISMILSLRPSNSHFSSNKSMLVKLTRLTIETGLVTSVAALLELILGIVFEQHLYHVAVFYAISKLYANCLLASLNFRIVLRSQSDPNLTAIVWDDMASNVPSRQLGSQPSHVTQFVPRVETDVEVVVEVCFLHPGSVRSL
ncbi:hypothetical protein EV363DRAFT_1490549, partial [Boletus edulis]